MNTPKCKSYSITQDSGYEYIKETDLSEPTMKLVDNGYQFNTKLISRTPLQIMKKEPECLYIKIS